MNTKEYSMCVSVAEDRLDALLPHDASVAVACSGGSDSMALVLLTCAWAKKYNIKMVALTVDHGLRKASAKEAKQVGTWLKKHGISHAILTWEGRKPQSNIQEEARKARYRLMAEHCKERDIKSLLVAHTLDDQAETFLLRLKRGSGVDGLAAMAEVTDMKGLRIVRPLLNLRKAQLIAFLKEKKQAYVVDPSNQNDDYDRVKIRKLIPVLSEAGLTPERMTLAANNMSRARRYLKKETEKFLEKHCIFDEKGYAELHCLPEDEEITLRALATLLRRIGETTPPRLDALTRLYKNVYTAGFKGATMAGCKLQRLGGKESLLFYREESAVQAVITIRSGETVTWDNRFRVYLEQATHPLKLGALTQSGWLAISKIYKLKKNCPDKKILYVLPALRDPAGTIVAVPHLGICAKGIRCHVERVTFPKT